MRISRRGSALLWVITFVAVTAAIAAMAAPYLKTLNDTDRVSDAVATLRAVGTGIVNFRASVGHFPSKTSMLTNVIHRVDHNSCWTNNTAGLMTTTDTANWVANGPYATMTVPVGGIWTPIGRLRDSIPQRIQNGAMFIEMPGVSITDAARFKAAVDSANGTTSFGDTVTVLHGAVGGGLPDTTTLRMRLFVAGTFNFC
jgi:hypothetical protein